MDNQAQTHDPVIEALFKDYGLVYHQTKSFDDFLQIYIPSHLNGMKLLDETLKKEDRGETISMDLSITNTFYGNPTSSLKDFSPLKEGESGVKLCRDTNSTYCIPLYIDVECTLTNSTIHSFPTRKEKDVGKAKQGNIQLGKENCPVLKTDTNSQRSTSTRQKITQQRDFPNAKEPLQLVKRERVLLGHIPLMVGSFYDTHSIFPSNSLSQYPTKESYNECPNDPGGYFLISGNEKVVIGQEKLAGNKIYVFENKDHLMKSEIRSVSHTLRKSVNFTVYFAYPAKLVHRVMYVSSPFFTKKDVKLIPLFYLLGLTTKDEIMWFIIGDSIFPDAIFNEMMYTMEDSNGIESEEDARKYYNNKIGDNNLDTILSYEFFPHIGSYGNSEMDDKRIKLAKAYCLARMVRKLLDVAHKRKKHDDRDDYANKRIDLCGNLLFGIFKNVILRMMKPIKEECSKFLSKYLHLQNFSLEEEKRKANSKDSKIHICSLFESCSKDLFKSFHYSLATGNWGMKGYITKYGVSQMLSRLNYLSTISHLRRITAPISKNSTSAKPRQLHNSQFGLFCSSEFPEGESAGFIKHLSIGAHISSRQDDKIFDYLYEPPNPYDNEEKFGMEPANYVLRKERQNGSGNLLKVHSLTLPKGGNSGSQSIFQNRPRTYLIVNGACKGYVYDGEEKYRQLIDYKTKRKVIPFDVSVHMEDSEIHISTDEGRCMRALYTIDEHGQLCVDKDIVARSSCSPSIRSSFGSLTRSSHSTSVRSSNPSGSRWFDYVNSGKIEYVDCCEQSNSLIYLSKDEIVSKKETPSYIHRYYCEIHPSLILGTSVATIPFIEHNPSPRVCYGSNMIKQGTGMYHLGHQNRFDTITYSLMYPQKPIVTTLLSDHLQIDEMASGVNAIVAILCYGGANIEDACIINQAALDRGMFRSFSYKTYITTENKTNVYEETFSNTSHSTLDADGTIPIGSKVSEDSVIVGKSCESISKLQNKMPHLDTKIKFGDQGSIDNILFSQNDKGQKMVKVKVRNEKVPEIGDKFASRYAQKHTLGITFRQEDMPFNHEGISPDIIINPHCIISRMTMGQILESALGKVGCMRGKIQYGTPFDHITVEEISEELKKCGLNPTGHEMFIDGMTGEQMDMLVFNGVVYYNRLKHLVSDKIHARARGSMQILTRQPMEGRSKIGGLKLGEMENHALFAHGVSHFLKEKMFTSSDKFNVDVCKGCKLMIGRNEKGESYCRNCDTFNHSVTIDIPYSMKLLIQELGAMGIKVEISTKFMGMDKEI